MKLNFTWAKLIYWLILNLIIVLLMDLAMFTQNTPSMKDASFLKKLGVAEFWATCEWLFLIPANRLGNTLLTAPQLSLSSFVFDFIGQILTNRYYLHIPTTIDDYAGMVIILIGMYISAYKVFK